MLRDFGTRILDTVLNAIATKSSLDRRFTILSSHLPDRITGRSPEF